MNFASSNASYEAWLKRKVPTSTPDFALKHRLMRESAFLFLRASFFRWCELWISHLPQLAEAPRVLAVGDLHVENFGTWRDQEGRLVWGINDFDEACEMPYLVDLVRLAASVALAIEQGEILAKQRSALAAILEGYEEGLSNQGSSFVLEEKHDWLREIALQRLKKAPKFWAKLRAVIPNAQASAKGVAILRRALPRDATDRLFGHRVAGLGSLGRARVVGLGKLHGGWIAREAKPLTVSAYAWAEGKISGKIRYAEIVGNANRAPDPYLSLHRGWVVRRLSPQNSRIDLSSLPKEIDELRLIRSMGMEIANVHLGSGNSRAVLKDLRARRFKDIEGAVAQMVELTLNDWSEWCGRSPNKNKKRRR